MRKTLTLVSTLSMFALAACGGGGGGADGGGGVDPAPQGPASMAPADLIAFANQGTTGSASIYYPNIRRTQNSVVIDGETVSVAVDRIAGSDAGLIQYREGNTVQFFTVDGAPVTTVAMPAGNYLGVLTLNYRETADGALQVSTGDMAMNLNLETGTVALGGEVSTATGSIEVGGILHDVASDATGISTDSLTVQTKDADNAITGTYTGTLDGTFIQGTSTSGVLGTLSAAGNDGFLATGGFTTTYVPQN